MKVGILTLPLHTNYGGILQAYALQLYLKRRGHTVQFIDRRAKPSRFQWIKEILKILVLRYKLKEQQERKYLRQNIDYFVDKYIESKTAPIYSSAAFEQSIRKNKLDAVVVGSDQVWRSAYIQNKVKDYFLGVGNMTQFKKLSYAASFGKDTWEGDRDSIKLIKPMLKDFVGISVREKSGVKLCEDLFNIKAEQHIDPVALLGLCDYEALIKKENEPVRDEDLLVYMLDIGPHKQNMIDRVKKCVGGKTFSINKPLGNRAAPLEERIYPTVTNWLKGFFDAKYVITDSFHGTIFSLMLNKPFIVYGNVERGLTRFYSLLDKVKLSHRIIQNVEDLSDKLIQEEIDWKSVNNIMDEEKKKTDYYFERLGM